MPAFCRRHVSSRLPLRSRFCLRWRIRILPLLILIRRDGVSRRWYRAGLSPADGATLRRQARRACRVAHFPRPEAIVSPRDEFHADFAAAQLVDRAASLLIDKPVMPMTFASPRMPLLDFSAALSSASLRPPAAKCRPSTSFRSASASRVTQSSRLATGFVMFIYQRHAEGALDMSLIRGYRRRGWAAGLSIADSRRRRSLLFDAGAEAMAGLATHE